MARHQSIRHMPILSGPHARVLDSYEPLTTTCACCCEAHHPDDIAGTTGRHAFKEAHLTAMADRYGGPVCNGCADDHTLCHHCETRIASPDYTAMSADETLQFCSAGCMDDWARS